MSIASGIQSLSQIIDRLPAGGYAVAAELVRQMRAVEKDASNELFDELVLLCHSAAQTIETLVGNEQLIESALLIQEHLREVVTFAEEWAAAGAKDDEQVKVRAPQPLLIADANEDQQYVETVSMFVSNALGALSDLEEELLSVESSGDRLEEIISSIRRTVHTLKAEFGVLNMLSPQALCHQAETTIDVLQEKGMPFPVDTMLAFGDLIKQFVDCLAADVKAEFGDPEPMLKTLRQLAQRTVDAAEAVEVAQGVLEPEPNADAAPAKDAEAPAAVVVATAFAAVSATAMKAVDAPVVVTPPHPPAKAKKTEARAARVERTNKVSTTRLDMLVDMVGELVIAQSMVLQDPAIQCLQGETLARNIGQVGKITRDLQEAAMSLRMVTVKSTFQKMARLVRDVAGKAGKRVALNLSGEETELDRNVVEQIADPLVHMIRNAIDHGIEAPDVRADIGKDEEGDLSLSAYHQGGSIVIEIRDDGRGLDRDKVFAKAVAKGLISNDASSHAMTDGEVYNMIFLPRFSTAQTVTELSGRGVGMDVVRRNIEALHGKIEIESTLGKGTIFRLRLPLTLAIIDGMIVRIGQSRYVVPTLSIEQSFRPNTEDVHHVVDRGECVHVRGAVLPVYRLNEVFDQADGCTDLGEGILIVVEVDGQRSCLFVDEILGQQQVVIKSLGLSRDRIVGLSGGAIMTDGRVALIVDVGTLVESILNV
ncbi:MAG: two-component system chemotaxis sensor kinase CheA [Planctomycetota bacterium]|jgi:two-component system chemotaxis sensor kinase CheA